MTGITRRWIDPRTNPEPPYAGPARPLADDHVELAGLITACKDGRLYDVEAWVASGKPLQLDARSGRSRGRAPSALTAAMAAGSFDLVRLLLCNGYRTELEARSPLNEVLDARRWDLLNLVLDWGADPATADLWRIFESYERAVFERFWNSGIDLTTGDAMAQALASATRNRSLYGFAKAFRERDPRIQRALDVGLGAAIGNRSDKAVSLCLWAGADPRRRVGDVGDNADDDADGMTGIERAVAEGIPACLKRFGFDPARDDVESLYGYACSASALRALVAMRPPNDWHSITQRLLDRLAISVRLDIRMTSLPEIEEVFAMGGRLGPLDRRAKGEIRRLLLSMNEWDAQRLLKLLRCPEKMDPDAFLDLAAHEKLAERYISWRRRGGVDRELLRELSTRPGVPRPVRRMAQEHLMPARVVLAHTVLKEADRWREISRQELYELVWSVPLTRLADRFGLSDTGLRKRCRAMEVPTPTRGYWQKVTKGRRAPRTPLPNLENVSRGKRS